MAVEFEDGPIKDFDLWYVDRKVDPRNGCIETRGGLSDQATRLIRRYDYFKREMDARCADYEKLVLLADGEVISPKPDLPNVSSGETAGIVRRIARNLVQQIFGNKEELAQLRKELAPYAGYRLPARKELAAVSTPVT